MGFGDVVMICTLLFLKRRETGADMGSWGLGFRVLGEPLVLGLLADENPKP